MNATYTARPAGVTAEPKGKPPLPDQVVELGLLLTAGRAEALIDLSKRRNQSVGQLLRGLIDRAIQEG